MKLQKLAEMTNSLYKFFYIKVTKCGNNFSISSTGIGEALKRSASSLYVAGNTIDESIALITGANEVVQDPESVGELIAHQHSNMLLVNSYIG